MIMKLNLYCTYPISSTPFAFSQFHLVPPNSLLFSLEVIVMTCEMDYHCHLISCMFRPFFIPVKRYPSIGAEGGENRIINAPSIRNVQVLDSKQLPD